MHSMGKIYRPCNNGITYRCCRKGNNIYIIYKGDNVLLLQHEEYYIGAIGRGVIYRCTVWENISAL